METNLRKTDIYNINHLKTTTNSIRLVEMNDLQRISNFIKLQTIKIITNILYASMVCMYCNKYQFINFISIWLKQQFKTMN